MSDSQGVVPQSPPDALARQGCLRGGMMTAFGGWLLLITIVYQVTAWTLEQGLFEGSIVRDSRWLWNLAYALAVIIPAALLGASMRNRMRVLYSALGLAGLFVLLQSPSRLAGIDNAQLSAVFQLAGCLLFLAAAGWAARRYGAAVQRHGQLRWYALALGGLVGLPWLLWGAFGSTMDLVLQGLAALLFGWSALRALQPIFTSGSNRTTNGFVTAMVLLVMASGFGVNGSQWLLAICLPPLAWGVVAASRPVSEAGLDLRAGILLVSLAVFWPLALVDPDELALVVTIGAGELFQYAAQAALLAGVLGFTGGLLGLPLAGWKHRPLGFALAAGTWIVLLLVYLLVGQPGLYGERLFVVMNSQADLTPLASMEDPQARRKEAYRLLVAHAQATQAPIHAVLDRLRFDYQPYYLENGLEVRGGPLLRLWLEARPEVARVLDSPVMRPLPGPVPISTGSASPPDGPQWNLQMIGANMVWEELGVTGRGIVVGQADSGVDGLHNELRDSYRGSSGANDYNWYDPWNHSGAPVDIGGHGTHTLGTVLGNTTGIAPDAQWIGCVNLARNLGNPALYLDCMQFLFAPFPQAGDPLVDGRPELGAHVLNNSWSCPPVEGCDTQVMRAAVDALRAAGVFVVASAGNDGDGATCGSVRDPIAMFDAVYSVGAIDSSRTLASFSSVGPVQADGSARIKPDIAAPGVDVLSAYPGGTYEAASGTSMAGPHVAGVVALMWSANPGLIGDIPATEEILNRTAQTYDSWLPDCVSPGRPNNAVGYGILDAYSAVKAALER